MTNDVTGQAARVNWRTVRWGVASLILLLPLAAMQLTDEVRWDSADFIFAGVLMGAVGLTYELAVSRTRDRAYRSGVAVALAATFLLVWANGAVGLIGSEDDSANLLFGLVPLTALVGAIGAGFRPAGMARALLAAAIAKLLVTGAVLAIGWSTRSPIWPRELVFAGGGFGCLWLASAWLFGKAARTAPVAR